jgi:hypothetical protein
MERVGGRKMCGSKRKQIEHWRKFIIRNFMVCIPTSLRTVFTCQTAEGENDVICEPFAFI